MRQRPQHKAQTISGRRGRLCLALFVSAAGLAGAGEGASPAGAATKALNAGFIQITAMPGGNQLGLYPYVTGSLAFTRDRLTLIPSVGVEWSPSTARWGFTGSAVLDVQVSRRVGADAILMMVHDTDTWELRQASYFAGAGTGLSFFFDKWVVSPSVSVFRGLNVPGWSLVPGVNLSVTP